MGLALDKTSIIRFSGIRNTSVGAPKEAADVFIDDQPLNGTEVEGILEILDYNFIQLPGKPTTKDVGLE